ncbi:MAG: DUF2863 family protein [Candidatus Nitricoxidivorans perseverans]|uniref:DUF2863 family protein n=1 Tax=Candidatus Nitricoxidivorans perseverans TaxID=2975601 RepID=A0AA49FNB3_9PROT|nr:MAG: DUF2863 family protein [Candidatus Nitricoxidivorans perseverans]
MKRTRFPRRVKQTPDTEQLIRLAGSLAHSTSRIEDAWWETRIAALVDRLLADGDEATLIATLDHLYGVGGRAYDELADLIESCCETRRIDAGGGQDMLLFAAPVLAWSRYAIPSGPVSGEVLANARVHLQAHVLGAQARLGLADFLWSPDQLPQSYAETTQLAEKLGHAALHGRDLKIDPATMAETVNFLSDTRYLIGAVAAPRGSALFRWQEDDVSRADVLKQWRGQGGEALRPLLPACATELLLPQPYHAAARDADRASRPYSLRAAVAFLQTTLNVAAAQLRAVMAPYYDRQLEEFRIGFTTHDSTDIAHGVVWPLLENEDEATDTPAQIEAVLREAGIGEIIALDQRFPLEFCDDCGAPLYPNPDGEPSHAELPEQESSTPRHLH